MNEPGDRAEAQKVADALRRFHDRLEEIMTLIDKKTLSRGEVEDARALLQSLKADLKRAAHDGKIDTRRGLPNAFERNFFEPAVRAASANLTARVNAHPHNSNWFSCLYGVQMDISHPLANLEQAFLK
jgi:thioredoxin-like negative regulator of GroEL